MWSPWLGSVHFAPRIVMSTLYSKTRFRYYIVFIIIGLVFLKGVPVILIGSVKRPVSKLFVKGSDISYFCLPRYVQLIFFWNFVKLFISIFVWITEPLLKFWYVDKYFCLKKLYLYICYIRAYQFLKNLHKIFNMLVHLIIDSNWMSLQQVS